MQLNNILQLALLVTPYAIASPLVPSHFLNRNPQFGASPAINSSEEAPYPILQPSAPAESLSPDTPHSDSPVSPPEAPNPTFEADADSTTVPLEDPILALQPS